MYSAPESKPFWSVMIPTYNPDQYLRVAIESVVNQPNGIGEMQIEVVDDCSDRVDVWRMVHGQFGDRVGFYRRPNRGGLAANWNDCVERAQGRWVHILHQDDYVLPGFYRKLRSGIDREPAIGAAFCRHILMDKDGHWLSIAALQGREAGILDDWLERIASNQLIQTPAIVVRRDVYEAVGGYSPELIFTLDWDMWKRIAVKYPYWYEPQPLACYRTHAGSETSRLTLSGLDLADAGKSISMSRAILPPKLADRASRAAGEAFALYGIEVSRQLMREGHFRAALTRVGQALKLRASRKVIQQVFRFAAWAAGCFCYYLPRKLAVWAGGRTRS
jgi:hypothetical protein